MRVVALLQPVYDGQTYRMVTVQVAETLELRKSLAQRGADLDAGPAGDLSDDSVGADVVADRPRLCDRSRCCVASCSAGSDSLSPLVRRHRELRPIVEALNEVMARLKGVLRQPPALRP